MTLDPSKIHAAVDAFTAEAEAIITAERGRIDNATGSADMLSRENDDLRRENDRLRAQLDAARSIAETLRSRLSDPALEPPAPTDPDPAEPAQPVPTDSVPADPVEVITGKLAVVTTGMAPATIHVDAWDVVDAVHVATDWTIKGPAMDDEAKGGNVAWWCVAPGEYTIELKAGGKIYREIVALAPDTRKIVHVQPGESIGDAIADNTRVVVHGEHVVRSTIGIGATNCIIQDGAGVKIVKPKKREGVAEDHSSAFTINGMAKGIIITGFEVWSDDGGERFVNVRDGRDVTVQNCEANGLKEFVKLDQAAPPSHVLIAFVRATVSTYAVYGAAGSNIVVDAVTAKDSSEEHCIRFGGGKRINLYQCFLHRKAHPTVAKTNIALQAVEQATVNECILTDFPGGVGPETSRPDDRARGVRWDGNNLINAELQINEGSNDIVVTRNNLSKGILIRTNGGSNGGVNDVLVEANTSPMAPADLVRYDERDMGPASKGVVVR